MALQGFAQGEVMPFLPGESSSFPEALGGFCSAACRGCRSWSHSWGGKMPQVRQIFTLGKKIPLFPETQGFPNSMNFLQLQILAVERSLLPASALDSHLALAESVPEQPLLLFCPHVPSRQTCCHLPPLTHRAAGASLSDLRWGSASSSPALPQNPGCITN